VCEDGRVYEGRGWNVRGSHTLGYNQISIGLCIIGDYRNRLPLTAALNATVELLACGVEEVENSLAQQWLGKGGHGGILKKFEEL